MHQFCQFVIQRAVVISCPLELLGKGNGRIHVVETDVPERIESRITVGVINLIGTVCRRKIQIIPVHRKAPHLRLIFAQPLRAAIERAFYFERDNQPHSRNMRRESQIGIQSPRFAAVRAAVSAGVYAHIFIRITVRHILRGWRILFERFVQSAITVPVAIQANRSPQRLYLVKTHRPFNTLSGQRRRVGIFMHRAESMPFAISQLLRRMLTGFIDHRNHTRRPVNGIHPVYGRHGNTLQRPLSGEFIGKGQIFRQIPVRVESTGIICRQVYRCALHFYFHPRFQLIVVLPAQFGIVLKPVWKNMICIEYRPVSHCARGKGQHVAISWRRIEHRKGRLFDKLAPACPQTESSDKAFGHIFRCVSGIDTGRQTGDCSIFRPVDKRHLRPQTGSQLQQRFTQGDTCLILDINGGAVHKRNLVVSIFTPVGSITQVGKIPSPAKVSRTDRVDTQHQIIVHFSQSTVLFYLDISI